MALLAGSAMLGGCSNDSSSGGSCGAFSACGGNLDATNWQIDDVCIEGDFVGTLNSQLSSLPADCRNVFQSAHIDASGTVGYASGVETANTEITASYLAIYSKACINALSSSTTGATSAICSNLQSGMNGAGSGVTASCAVAGADCDCNVTQKIASGSKTDGYTVKGSTLEYSSGDSPMSFCVQGNTLQERSTVSTLGLEMLVTAHRI